MSNRLFNFSAGPATLPEPVIEKAQKALWNHEDSGIGIMECSHRGPEFIGVLARAQATCRELLSIPDTYDVLFLQGGASSQFFMVPMNLLSTGHTADYVNTGAWSKKAIKEAKLFGDVCVAATSEDENFTYIPGPDATKWSNDAVYAHFTSNNTIAGTEFASEPTPPAGVPLICDASSDILSRPLDITKYGMIYAGAQKNLGPAGVTLVIIRKDLVEKGAKNIPTMLQYRTHADKDSCFNTPPTFGIYVLGEVMAWIRDFGGLPAMAEYNQAKAKIIYDYLDSTDFYRAGVRPDSRSLMNIVFNTANEEHVAPFLAGAKKKGLSGLKGHRSVGGMRASIYNAFPTAGCARLVEYMKEFEQANK